MLPKHLHGRALIVSRIQHFARRVRAFASIWCSICVLYLSHFIRVDDQIACLIACYLLYFLFDVCVCPAKYVCLCGEECK
jgi:divalent metal cation (Fe/Co/Zn/Cd) transporter